MSKKEAAASSTVVTETLFLNSKPCVLFVSGATHSFISSLFVLQLNLENAMVETNYRIKLPNDFILECLVFYKHVTISIGGTIFLKV